MKDLGKTVLGKLRERGTRPLPAWRFTLANVLTWIGFAMFALLGAQAISVMLHVISGHDWTRLERYRGGSAVYLLQALPYLWMLLLALLLAAAYLDFRRTETGYRYRAFFVIAGLTAFSFLAGFGMYAAGIGGRTDESLARHLPTYRGMVPQGIQMWNAPEEGRLSGMVLGLGEDRLTLRNPTGRQWLVMAQEGSAFPEWLDDGLTVRMVGRLGEDGEFLAKEIMPWRPGFMRKDGLPARRPDGDRQMNLRWQEGRKPPVRAY